MNRYARPKDCDTRTCAFASEFTSFKNNGGITTEKRCLIAEALKKYIREE
jgi:hypothetical protein